MFYTLFAVIIMYAKSICDTLVIICKYGLQVTRTEQKSKQVPGGYLQLNFLILINIQKKFK